MILTQDTPPTGEGVLIQLARRPQLTQLVQVTGEVVSGPQGIGVVLAQDPATPGEGVLV